MVLDWSKKRSLTKLEDKRTNLEATPKAVAGQHPLGSRARGGHLGRAWELPNHAGLAVDLLAAWRHEILDGVFRSGASFRGYGNAGFESSTDLVGRNALLTQGSLRLTRGNDFFAQVDLAGNSARRPHPSTWA